MLPLQTLLLLLTTTTSTGLASGTSPPTQHQTSQTAKLTLRLPAPGTNPLLPNPAALPASTRATLSTLGLSYAAPLSADNTFVFPAVNITTGGGSQGGASYLAEVHCPTHAFAPLRLDVFKTLDPGEGGKGEVVTVKAWETIRGNDWGNKGEEVKVLGGGEGKGFEVEVRVLGGKGYFMERSSFSVLSVFKNPIILLSLVSMALFFGMPKLVENMDPELRAEWEQHQKENPMNALMAATSGQGANPMGNFDMAAFLAGSKSKSSSSSSSAAADSNGGGKAKGEAKKKR
ncbi:hypothetical protein VTJ04DRAFT_9214 [Mycothermus thermophilus]|uniref:uncharacterized protein n=1 Tax=Humicola insolens TaxID=85995 RepID=UPI0037437A10